MSLTKVSFSMIKGAVANVLDFGATGDGVTDDTVAIQAAAASAIAVKGALYFPKGTYQLSGTVVCTSINIFGDGQEQSIVSAASVMGSMFAVSGRSTIMALKVLGNNKANYCLEMTAVNGSNIQSCNVEGAVYDNVLYQTVGNNSTSKIDTSLIRICGKEYATGTAAGTIGGTTVTVSGAANLTTVGMRNERTYAFFASDTSGYAYEVMSLTSTTIEVYPALASTFAGSSYKLLTGSNIAITRSGDNSSFLITNTSLQAAKVAGIEDKALYACKSISNTIEGNGYGRIIGMRGNGQAVFGALEIGNYYEAQTYKDILYAYSVGNTIAIPYIGGAFDTSYIVFSGAASPTIIASTPQSIIPAKGIQFPGTQSVSSDPNVLDDYEEGTWTPVDFSPAALVFTANAGKYTKIGRQVTASCTLTYPATATANAAFIAGLPFAQATPANQSGGFVSLNTSATPIAISAYSADVVQPVNLAGAAVANSLLSTAIIGFTFIYTV